ncbi:DUF4293 domain-containing protein [Bacteroidales bacterium OttesenSCG-928-B11]|nr:DUF4293 domain-containing protein [Bacteroidales bacterium OttesenSCG-928-C03]MDL2312399.1 DUF4293 domain-containing protein [Bacteroidales bacterium OttesenSCG-928-B11]
MIQRIQSVYLLIAAIATTALLFMPIGEFYFMPNGAQDFMVFTYNAFSVKDITPGATASLTTNYIAILIAISAVLSIVTVFMFKKRQRQITMNYVNMLIFLFVIALALFIYPDIIFVKKGLLVDGEELSYNFWILIPLCITALCLFLANKAIKKDEKMVRAADRLR